MSLFDILESEEPASEPELFDMDQFVQGRKALTRSGKVATFVGFGRNPYDNSPHIVIRVPWYPLKSPTGRSWADCWVDLDGRWSPIDDGPGGALTLVSLI